MGIARGSGLVGRDEEIAALHVFAERLTAAPAGLVIRGEPGIGKTVLWRHTVGIAETRGARVLVARCAEAEMPVPLGAIADLIDPVYDEVAEALPVPQRWALAVALGLEGSSTARPDRLALLRAVAAAFRSLTAERPLLVAVDDVQWLDLASLRALAFAARRTGEAPIGVLATLRGAPEEREPLGLAEAFGPDAFEEIALGPLGPDALQQLVRERFGVRIPRSELAAVHAACGGNPMFALEFARSAAALGVELGALPVPSSLQSLVQDRVRALPATSLPLLELVSVIERPTLSVLARAIGDADATDALVDEAVSAGAIGVGHDGVVRFTHPLLGSAVYHELSGARRRALHLEIAHLADDVEERARHLALATAGADAAVANAVEQAATTATERGAPEAAAVLALEALRLTPMEDEDTRVRRTFASAGFLMEAGDVHEARALIEPLLDPALPEDVRAQALVIRAETEHQDRKLLVACLREAIEIAPDARVRAHALLRYAQHGGWISGDAGTAADSAREAYSIARELDDAPLTAISAAALAYYEAGRGNRIVELDEEALLRVELPRMAPWQITPAISLGARLLWAGELDRARDALRRERDELERQGAMVRLPIFVLTCLFDVEWRAGNRDAAEACIEEAQSIVDDAFPGAAVVLYPARVLLAGSHGSVEDARNLAVEGHRLSGLRDDRVNPPRVNGALGHVELSHGDAAAAMRVLGHLPEALDDFGIGEPAMYPILPDVVEALTMLGRLDEAETVQRQLEAQAAALDHRWATPVALRCRALLLLGRERAEEAAAAAERSAQALRALGFPLDEARGLFVAGSAWRRAGQRGRAAELLRESASILAGLPAPLWLERVEEELRRAAPRPRRDRDLTETERRVAALVVEGRTNREVAAELFVTVTTVEAHLTRIYRKTGVRSRTELAHAVADGSVALVESTG